MSQTNQEKSRITAAKELSAPGGTAGAKNFLRNFLLRFGPPELAGTAASLLLGYIMLPFGSGAAALLATHAENFAFYAVLIGRDYREAAREVSNKSKKLGLLAKLCAETSAKFGPAEFFDTLAARPLLIYYAQYFLGSTLTALFAGKILADILYYVLVLLNSTAIDKLKKVKFGTKTNG